MRKQFSHCLRHFAARHGFLQGLCLLHCFLHFGLVHRVKEAPVERDDLWSVAMRKTNIIANLGFFCLRWNPSIWLKVIVTQWLIHRRISQILVQIRLMSVFILLQFSYWKSYLCIKNWIFLPIWLALFLYIIRYFFKIQWF